MVAEIFFKIGILLGVAVGVSFIMRLLKQPLLIGYIITGIISGPYLFGLLSTDATIDTFAQIGVALLLFTVGLHLNPKIIKKVGKISTITGLGQIIFTSAIGFVISKFLLGFSTVVSIYISVALTFSSTIIIMKLLSDKGDLETIYGKISVGFLIVQDLVAVFALMIISSLNLGGDVVASIGLTLFKGIVAISVLVLFGYFALPKLTRIIARSQELLFLFSITWALLLAMLFQYLNLSMEIGALLAGIVLSMSPYSSEISSKLRPLRDFFIIMFFIVIGSQMIIQDVRLNLVPIVVFSLFILIGNPLIVMTIMGVMGHTKRNSFLAGLTVAQISEFSIILVSLGVSVGHLTTEILSLVTTVGLITIAGSTYMIMYSNKLYNLLSPHLGIFESRRVRKSKESREEYSAILFGYNRIGFNILRALKGIKQKYLVVDFNPDVIDKLSAWRMPSLYGDVYDEEFLQALPLSKTKIAISTIPDLETNELLIQNIRAVNPDAIIIVRSHQVDEALKLYKLGADYVLTPHFLGGEYVANMIRDLQIDGKGYKKERDKHVKMLDDILKSGKKHPSVERG